MNAHVSNNELTYVVPSALSTAGSTVHATSRKRAGLVARLAGWIGEMPRRRAVLSELSALSDHELADIGLARGDLARVFDPEFAHSRSRI